MSTEPETIIVNYKIVDNKYVEVNIDQYDLTGSSYIIFPFGYSKNV